jgi:hypothetical protein
MNKTNTTRLSRREVLQWFAASMAAAGLPRQGSAAAEPTRAPAAASGYGTDPKVAAIYSPGDFWPLTLDPIQLQTVTALADWIFPEDDLGPAASTLRVPEFINEWVSAPYPQQQHDRGVVLPGLLWLEAEAQKRFSTPFARLSASQAEAILDAVCSLPDALPEHKQGAVFFACFRNIAAGAYYRTPEGWKALGYVGNTPSATFEGAPRELLEQLGLS